MRKGGSFGRFDIEIYVRLWKHIQVSWAGGPASDLLHLPSDTLYKHRHSAESIFVTCVSNCGVFLTCFRTVEASTVLTITNPRFVRVPPRKNWNGHCCEMTLDRRAFVPSQTGEKREEAGSARRAERAPPKKTPDTRDGHCCTTTPARSSRREPRCEERRVSKQERNGESTAKRPPIMKSSLQSAKELGQFPIRDLYLQICPFLSHR